MLSPPQLRRIQTERGVAVYWLSNSGEEQFFYKLSAKCSITQETFCGNIWIVKEDSPQQKLMKRCKVHHPGPALRLPYSLCLIPFCLSSLVHHPLIPPQQKLMKRCKVRPGTVIQPPYLNIHTHFIPEPVFLVIAPALPFPFMFSPSSFHRFSSPLSLGSP